MPQESAYYLMGDPRRSTELDHAEKLLRQAGNGRNDSEINFMQTRLNRARQQRQRATRIFNTCPPIARRATGEPHYENAGIVGWYGTDIVYVEKPLFSITEQERGYVRNHEFKG